MKAFSVLFFQSVGTASIGISMIVSIFPGIIIMYSEWVVHWILELIQFMDIS